MLEWLPKHTVSIEGASSAFCGEEITPIVFDQREINFTPMMPHKIIYSKKVSDLKFKTHFSISTFLVDKIWRQSLYSLTPDP